MGETSLCAALLRDIDDDPHRRKRSTAVVVLQPAARHGMTQAALRVLEAIVESSDGATAGIDVAEFSQKARLIIHGNGAEPDVGPYRPVAGRQSMHLPCFRAAVDEARLIVAPKSPHASDVERQVQEILAGP